MTHPTENPFLEAGPDAILLDELTLAGRQSVLERLGPAGFRSKGFSFIGFLETLYDYIADQANGSASVPTAEIETETAAKPGEEVTPPPEPIDALVPSPVTPGES